MALFNTSIPDSIANGRFKVDQLIGQGSFGSIFTARDTKTQATVAVKFQSRLCDTSDSLANEYKHLSDITSQSRPQGFTQSFSFGKVGAYYYLAMELLKMSLEDAKDECPKGKMSLRSAVFVAQQVLQRIEYLHSKAIVHRDIKPDNFMFGVGGKRHHLYLIDFGLSCSYWNKDGHIDVTREADFVGTPRYASINAHDNLSQSRRDDLEAIGYMLIYLMRGKLPWSGLQIADSQERCCRIRDMKSMTCTDKLCKDVPREFACFLDHVRELHFDERPDYEKLYMLLRSVQERHFPDVAFERELEWMRGSDVEDLVPLNQWESHSMPDDYFIHPMDGKAVESSCLAPLLFFRKRNPLKRNLSHVRDTE